MVVFERTHFNTFYFGRVWQSLRNSFLTVSTLEGCRGPERTELKVSTFRGCVGLQRTDF